MLLQEKDQCVYCLGSATPLLRQLLDPKTGRVEAWVVLAFGNDELQLREEFHADRGAEVELLIGKTRGPPFTFRKANDESNKCSAAIRI